MSRPGLRAALRPAIRQLAIVAPLALAASVVILGPTETLRIAPWGIGGLLLSIALQVLIRLLRR